MVGGCGEVWASDKATYALVVLASRSTKEGMYVDGDTPMTYTEAMKEEEIWGQAMKKEIGGLKEMIGVWRLVPKPAGANIVGIKWAYTRKFDEESNWKPMARLVEKGFHQIPGIDYFETHTAVIRFESLRIIHLCHCYPQEHGDVPGRH